MAAIQGLRGSGQFTTDFRPTNYRELFTLLEPNGTAPLQALLSMAGSEATDDPKYNHLRDELPDRKLTIDGAIADAVTTTIVVDAADDENFVVPGTILINVATGEVMRATSASSAQSITVERNIGGTSHNIGDGDNVIIGGFADSEGGNSPTAIRFDPTTYYNYTQIFKNAVTIADTDEGLDKAGRSAEMAYQTLKIAKEQKLDIEKALFSNNARVSGSATVARELAGAPSWMTTNITNAGTGGANPTGDGTDARTDGTQTAFTQADFDSAMQSIWENGGRPDSVYLSAFQMNTALGFTGNNNQRSTVQAGDEKVIKSLDVYVTPWGTVEFVPTRENRGRDVFIMQNDMWACAT